MEPLPPGPEGLCPWPATCSPHCPCAEKGGHRSAERAPERESPARREYAWPCSSTCGRHKNRTETLGPTERSFGMVLLTTPVILRTSAMLCQKPIPLPRYAALVAVL